MPQSFACLYYHIIFGTKRREPLLTPAVQPRLFAYLGGILRARGGNLLAAGGMSDHVHLLVTLDRNTSIADAVRDLKANSSRWIHETFPDLQVFAWQVGYGAFTVSCSSVPAVGAYIARQAEHHRRVTFQEEYVAFLRRHGIELDERNLWD